MNVAAPRVTDPRPRSRALRRILCAAALFLLPCAAHAAEPFQWGHWWLPTDHSEHGHRIDTLFLWIFWITTVALVVVQAALVYFLIKYRRKQGDVRRAHFIHGNTRLEMAWTLAPAVILAVLALASKDVWHRYRYNDLPPEQRAQMMVVGEQFKWNVIYGGPDNKVGKYLRFPLPSEPRYRMLSAAEARRAANDDIGENTLGKVTSAKDDPAGVDDDWSKFPGRPMIIPVDTTMEVLLGSKDVLHSFFLPNFRVKLDAVPGMIGHIYFKAKPDSLSTIATPPELFNLHTRVWIDRDTKGAAAVSDTEYVIFDPGNDQVIRRLIERQFAALDDESRKKLDAAGLTPGSVTTRLLDPALAQQRSAGLKPLFEAELGRLGQESAKPLADAGLTSIISGALASVGQINTESDLRGILTSRLGSEGLKNQAAVETEIKQLAADFRRAGITELTAIRHYEIVCEELCGGQHATMRGELFVVTKQQYHNFINKNAAPQPAPTAATDAPGTAVSSTASQGF